MVSLRCAFVVRLMPVASRAFTLSWTFWFRGPLTFENGPRLRFGSLTLNVRIWPALKLLNRRAPTLIFTRVAATVLAGAAVVSAVASGGETAARRSRTRRRV